jgi:hypothetical protein
MTLVSRLNDKQFNGHRVRVIPHPLDEVIIQVIDTYRGASKAQRQAMLEEVTQRSGGVLCASAERLAAMAVRANSVAPLYQALVAIGIGDEALEDYRDHLFSLTAVDHSAGLLSTTLSALIDTVANELPPAGLTCLHMFNRRQPRDRSLQAFGLRTEGEGPEFRYR